MKNIFLTCSFILVSIFALGQSPAGKAKLEAKQGIRDIKLGTPKSKYNDLYKVESVYVTNTIKGINYKSKIPCGTLYRRRNENLNIAGEKVSKIEYLYVNNILSGIYIYFKDNFTGAIDIEESLEELYGRPNILHSTRKWRADSFEIISDRALYEDGMKVVYIKNDISKRCQQEDQQSKQRLKNEL